LIQLIASIVAQIDQLNQLLRCDPLSFD